MLSLLFLFGNLEVDVVLVLALFVILTRANLCALLGGTISVLEAPVANLELTSLSVLSLFGVKVFIIVLPFS